MPLLPFMRLQKRIRDHNDRGMPMKPGPQSPLIVIPAQQGLGLLMELLDMLSSMDYSTIFSSDIANRALACHGSIYAQGEKFMPQPALGPFSLQQIVFHAEFATCCSTASERWGPCPTWPFTCTEISQDTATT